MTAINVGGLASHSLYSYVSLLFLLLHRAVEALAIPFVSIKS